MPGRNQFAFLFFVLLGNAAQLGPGQVPRPQGTLPQATAPGQMASAHAQVLDRIAARVEDDILFESELMELGRFQQLTGGQKEEDAKLLDRLIDQWIVNMEAAAAHFGQPSPAEVEKELLALQKQFGSPEAFEIRRREAGLTEAELKRLVKQQIYLTSYLDYKFRAAIQIPQSEIEKYYRETLAPQLAVHAEAVPALASVEDQIREVLVQREINLRADRWLEETRARLRLERNLNPK